MEDVCTLICPGGGRILDPFAGTGTTGVAARNTANAQPEAVARMPIRRPTLFAVLNVCWKTS